MKTGSPDSSNQFPRSLYCSICLALETVGSRQKYNWRGYAKTRGGGKLVVVESRNMDCSNANCAWTIFQGMTLRTEADGLISPGVHSVHHRSVGQSAQGCGSPPGSLLSHGPKWRATEPTLRDSKRESKLPSGQSGTSHGRGAYTGGWGNADKMPDDSFQRSEWKRRDSSRDPAPSRSWEESAGHKCPGTQHGC